MTNAEHLIYLYGIVPADGPDPTAELLGIEDAPVYVQQIGKDQEGFLRFWFDEVAPRL